MDNKSLNKEPLLEWANFIDEAHKDDEAYVNIKSNHLFTNEEYEELLCEKYGLDKDDWTIVSDFDLLENYIKKKFIVCNSCGVIRYYADYDEKEKKYPAADAKGQRLMQKDLQELDLASLTLRQNLRYFL